MKSLTTLRDKNSFGGKNVSFERDIMKAKNSVATISTDLVSSLLHTFEDNGIIDEVLSGISDRGKQAMKVANGNKFLFKIEILSKLLPHIS